MVEQFHPFNPNPFSLDNTTNNILYVTYTKVCYMNILHCMHALRPYVRTTDTYACAIGILAI
jgi:hypothetical protein